MQNDVSIRLNRSIEQKYKRTNNEHAMVSEQKPHLMPHDNSGKIKRANLAVIPAKSATSVLSELLIFKCNSNYSFFLNTRV